MGQRRLSNRSSKHTFVQVVILICAVAVVSRLAPLVLVSYYYDYDADENDNGEHETDITHTHTHTRVVNQTHHSHDHNFSHPPQARAHERMAPKDHAPAPISPKTTTTTTACNNINSALNISAWPPVKYHKILQEGNGFNSNSTNYQQLPWDDRQALASIDQFNKLRPHIFTKQLLDVGFSLGNDGYRVQTFANRLLESSIETTNGKGKRNKPLTIAITGSSFAIGSNCGESQSQPEKECSWPYRLSKRWKSIVSSSSFFPGAVVNWKMLQTNAQNSVNVAHLIPSLLDEFSPKNDAASATLDAIILDGAITDSMISEPWFEALVRAIVKHFPQTLIISLVDAIPRTVARNDNGVNHFMTMMHAVQDHYGLTVVDFPKMVRFLYNTSEHILGNIEVTQQLKAYQNLTRGNVEVDQLDFLWPQSSHMISGNGTSLGDIDALAEFINKTPVYWANYLPVIHKTKAAYYPDNHPPWSTHQYVSDSVMYALLSVARAGLGCDHDEVTTGHLESSPREISNETVADKEKVDDCFICLSPLSRRDAKTTRYVTNLTSIGRGDAQLQAEQDVAVMCGDWKWITDERNRSGWQSDQAGSIIRFRLKIGDKPTISITHMRSWQTFGDLRVIFLPVLKELEVPANHSSSTHSSLLCGDVIPGNQKDKENATLPSIILDGNAEEFSLWTTTVFPHQQSIHDLNTEIYWSYMNRTVLGQKYVEYVDVYVVNPNKNAPRTRIKIQSVQSC